MLIDTPIRSNMSTRQAVLVRPANVRTMTWILQQAELVRKNRGRVIGAGPLVEACLNALVESQVSFSDCAGMSDVQAKLCRILNGRFAPATSTWEDNRG